MAATEGLVTAVNARGLYGLRASAQQICESAERGERAERAQCAGFAEQLRERDGRRERASRGRARGAAGRATLQIRLLKLHTAGAG